MEYFNGYQNCEVEKASELASLNQEQINILASGPQDSFFEKLEIINNELIRHGIEPLDVTNAWNWKPGSYDKIKEYMYKKLHLNKKAMSIANVMVRAQDKMNYMNYIQRQAKELEFDKYKLKELGIRRNIDPEEFKEKCKAFVDKLIDGCTKLWEATEGKVSIKPYFQLEGRQNSWLYYDITLQDMNLSVYDGRDEVKIIQEIPMEDIHIVLGASLRHVLNNMRSIKMSTNGKYKSGLLNLAHPYISNQTYRSNNYGSVCFDNYNDDILKAIKNNEIMTLGMLLMQWAQYYNIKVANPYNQPYMSHLGMPESFSKEYKSTQSSSSVADRCSHLLMNFAQNELKVVNFEQDDIISTSCNKINCSLKETCSLSKGIIRRQDRRNSEWWCQVESYVMTVIDILWEECDEDGYINTDKMTEPLSQLIGQEFWKGDRTLEEWRDYIIDELLWYYANALTHKFDDYAYYFLEKYGFIEKPKEEEPPSVVDMDEEQVKIIMKSWAETQGGR